MPLPNLLLCPNSILKSSWDLYTNLKLKHRCHAYTDSGGDKSRQFDI